MIYYRNTTLHLYFAWCKGKKPSISQFCMRKINLQKIKYILGISYPYPIFQANVQLVRIPTPIQIIDNQVTTFRYALLMHFFYIYFSSYLNAYNIFRGKFIKSIMYGMNQFFEWCYVATHPLCAEYALLLKVFRYYILDGWFIKLKVLVYRYCRQLPFLVVLFFCILKENVSTCQNFLFCFFFYINLRHDLLYYLSTFESVFHLWKKNVSYTGCSICFYFSLYYAIFLFLNMLIKNFNITIQHKSKSFYIAAMWKEKKYLPQSMNMKLD